MKHLFELGCLYSGQILSFTKIMGQLHEAGNTTTLSHYLSLLDTAGLLTGIEKYANNTIRKRSSSPKFQVYNNALISAQSTDTFEMVQKDPAKWGRVVESAVGTHLLNQSLTEQFELSYWREGSAEVDFVLKKQDKIIAIEVKSSKAAITDGMRKFKTQFSPNKMLLVGADGLPWEQFLKTDIAGL
jgi:predicted AAA+ superfamily ATPase